MKKIFSNPPIMMATALTGRSLCGLPSVYADVQGFIHHHHHHHQQQQQAQKQRLEAHPLSVMLPEAGTAMRWAALWRARRRRMRFWAPAAQ
jgi:hypothetical protein